MPAPLSTTWVTIWQRRVIGAQTREAIGTIVRADRATAETARANEVIRDDHYASFRCVGLFRSAIRLLDETCLRTVAWCNRFGSRSDRLDDELEALFPRDSDSSPDARALFEWLSASALREDAPVGFTRVFLVAAARAGSRDALTRWRAQPMDEYLEGRVAEEAASRGRLAFVVELWESGRDRDRSEIAASIAEGAVAGGHIPIIAWVFRHLPRLCPCLLAARHLRADVLRWARANIHGGRRCDSRPDILDSPIKRGDAETVTAVLECTTARITRNHLSMAGSPAVLEMCLSFGDPKWGNLIVALHCFVADDNVAMVTMLLDSRAWADAPLLSGIGSALRLAKSTAMLALLWHRLPYYDIAWGLKPAIANFVGSDALALVSWVVSRLPYQSQYLPASVYVRTQRFLNWLRDRYSIRRAILRDRYAIRRVVGGDQ